MKAIGRNLIIEKIAVGDEIKGLNENDTIYFDRHAGHKIEVEDNTYHVIKSQDVVVVL